MKVSLHKKTIHFIVIPFLLICTMFIFATNFAYASEVVQDEVEVSDSTTDDTKGEGTVTPHFTDMDNEIDSRFNLKVKTIGNVLTTIIECFSALALAFNGIRMFLGSEDSAEKAYKEIVVIMIALVVFLFLPYCIKLGKNIGAEIAWNPATLGK